MLPQIIEDQIVPQPEYNYTTINELIIVLTATLDGNWLLYFLLAMQPILTGYLGPTRIV